MFVEYYKLKEQPFGVTPNPRFLFLTPTHREAIASIVYGVMENRGFTALIAPPGMGKTTLLFELLQRLGDSVRTVFLFQFQPTPEGLFRNLLSELGVPDDGLSLEAMQEKLNQLILQESKKGKRIVVVVDEAQNFHEPVLEVLRMLSNFETSQDKLIHIVLSGQPQLAEMLFSPSIEQLRQRISTMAVLRPLDPGETRDYIEHRLRVAGYRGGGPLFTNAACERIAHYAQGIPRNINNICFNALSLGYALQRPTIDYALIDETFGDLTLQSGSEASPKKVPSADANANANAWTRFAAPTSLPAMWPPIRPQASGKGLSFMAGVVSFAAVLLVAGVFAKQYVIPTNPADVSLRTPAPPVPQMEIVSPAPSQQVVEVPAKAVQPDPEPNPEPVRATPMRQQKPRRQQAASVEQQPVKLVRVAQRQSLYDLCRKNLGACDVNAIYEIRRLNPRLRYATQVESGEAVRLPLATSEKRWARYSAKINSGEKP